jgi:3-deoxy-D-manno-octulosonic-acid transferase
MTGIYYVLMALSLAMALPFFLLSDKRRKGILQKLGLIPASLRCEIDAVAEQPSVWFHAVSVGEFSGALSLVREFAKRNPQFHIFVSTTTATGQAIAQQRLSEIPGIERVTVFYFPFDLPFALHAWLELIRPSMAVIVETEIWPGFTYECKRRGIKLAMINARMSPRSFSGYMFMRPIFSKVVTRFDLIATQSEEESQRFLELCPADSPKIEATGNLKYDRQQPISSTEITQLRKQLNLGPDDQVIIGGSTHEGEEAALLEIYSRLNTTNTRLILVPRHPERWDSVCRLVESYGFNPCRHTRGQSLQSERDVYVLDTIGELSRFYSIATVAFVGGSLVPIGGHNLVEPYVYKVPVVSGSHLFKTRSVASELEKLGALAVVHSTKELERELLLLLTDKDLRQKRGAAGNSWLEHSQGAIAHTLELLEELLEVNTYESRFPQPA